MDQKMKRILVIAGACVIAVAFIFAVGAIMKGTDNRHLKPAEPEKTTTAAPQTTAGQDAGTPETTTSAPEETTKKKKKGKTKEGFIEEDGVTRYYVEDVPLIGINTIEGKTYLFDGTGAMLKGLQTVENLTYYFGADGVLVKDQKVDVDGVTYSVDSNGVATVYKEPKDYKIAMLGDSLVHNIATANATDRIDFYGKSATHVDDYYDKKISGSDRFVIDEIKDRGYDIIILMVGINDVYLYEDDQWLDGYRDLIAAVRERAPDAQIYLHAMLPTNDQVQKTSGYSSANADIQARNQLLKGLAEEEGLPYIDAAVVVGDSSGYLNADLTTDGIHMTAEGCKIWADWLLETLTK